jgi:hypothetical protein
MKESGTPGPDDREASLVRGALRVSQRSPAKGDSGLLAPGMLSESPKATLGWTCTRVWGASVIQFPGWGPERTSEPERASAEDTPANDLGLSCASNMVAPRSEVQAELCGPTNLPKRQLQTLVRGLHPVDLTGKITRSQSW